ncbi:hypothetical protein XENOCAPTIV_002765, partial [Xenoophorus captivus]
NMQQDVCSSTLKVECSRLALLASPEIYSRSLKVISEIFCKLALIWPVLTLPGALPLDPMELTRDLKNRSEPSPELNLQADSSVSHQRSESCPPSQHLLSAPSLRTRRSRRATLSYTTGSMTFPPGGFPCAYL